MMPEAKLPPAALLYHCWHLRHPHPMGSRANHSFPCAWIYRSWELLRATLFPGRNLGGISIGGVCRGREVWLEVLGLLSGKPLLARVLAVV